MTAADTAASVEWTDMTGKTLIAAGAVVVAVLSGCTAHAEPSKFPDLSGYTPVNIADYRIDMTTPGHPSSEIYFLTPDGITCNFPIGAAQCRGNNLPGIPPAEGSGVNWIGTDTGLKQTNEGPVSGVVHGQQVKTLPPFHSITLSGVICGVDDKRMTACKDPQGRGFVLSPSWSGWIPKV
ncbi:hypothetical protein C0J29_32365 (plasmid) [Mycobacterium paragordonae]|uniref:DUF3558 domain-containing protein n=1 Tax=Mycobacterium paragordonae TaxID=1389713 RepID=A0ABQ1CGG8_9MYCO|nr:MULTISPECIES: hypothetical protein [Mycobacterium]AYE99659.1 hypothetical protein C0J29_32365 [Mycobacterium paragordonae]MDP7707587.1 hypothetical protein [Mycobacterium sp. TY815]GFG83281.1 hypothetical protein MPRG_65570 [Mycobacterium paragordonae]